MTDFLEMAMADIDDVFFQEFVEQHTIDGETFDVVPYETGLKERKSHWEAGAKQNFDQGLYISQKQFFIRTMALLQRLESRWSTTESATR